MSVEAVKPPVDAAKLPVDAPTIAAIVVDSSPSSRLLDRLSRREHHRADRHREAGLDGGHHRCLGMSRKTLGDKRNLGAAAGHRHRREISAANSAAPQHVIERREDAAKLLLDQAFQFGSSHLDGGTLPGEFNDQLGLRLVGQPLFGQPAFFSQIAELPDDAGAGGIGAFGAADAFQAHEPAAPDR